MDVLKMSVKLNYFASHNIKMACSQSQSSCRSWSWHLAPLSSPEYKQPTSHPNLLLPSPSPIMSNSIPFSQRWLSANIVRTSQDVLGFYYSPNDGVSKS